MRFYFSGGEKDEPLLLIPRRQPHLMLSFYQMPSRINRKIVRSFIRQQRGEEKCTIGSLFMDSGAFTEIATHGHTELEQRVMRSWRWFSRDEIEAHDEPIFPVDLADMLDRLLHGD